MPQELGEGLYLAGAGMGVVFFSLLVFLFILLTLRRLSPGGTAASARLGAAESMGVVAQQAQPTAGGEPSETTTGERVVAAAVAAYLAMEHDDPSEQASSETPAPAPRSRWSAQGRAHTLGSHGRRPPPYGRKPNKGCPCSPDRPTDRAIGMSQLEFPLRPL